MCCPSCSEQLFMQACKNMCSTLNKTYSPKFNFHSVFRCLRLCTHYQTVANCWKCCPNPNATDMFEQAMLQVSPHLGHIAQSQSFQFQSNCVQCIFARLVQPDSRMNLCQDTYAADRHVAHMHAMLSLQSACTMGPSSGQVSMPLRKTH